MQAKAKVSRGNPTSSPSNPKLMRELTLYPAESKPIDLRMLIKVTIVSSRYSSIITQMKALNLKELLMSIITFSKYVPPS